MRPRKAAAGIVSRRYVAEGFKEDLYDLLKQFKEEGHYTYADFLRLWKKKQMFTIYITVECKRGFSHFNLIKRQTRLRLLLPTMDYSLFVNLYGPRMAKRNPLPEINLWWRDVTYGYIRQPDFVKGRTCRRELCEFTQECFATVFTILRFTESVLGVKAGAMYCLYCLYECQPSGKFKIRITLDDNKCIWDLLEIARKERLYTLALVIVTLRYKSAFQIVGSTTFMEPGLAAIKTIALEESKLPLMLTPRWSKACRDLYKSDAMKDFLALIKDYEKLKKEIGYENLENPNADGTECVSMLEKVANLDLETCWSLLSDSNDSDEDDDDDATSECASEIGARRRRLKLQQMGAPVDVTASSRTEGESPSGNEEVAEISDNSTDP